MRSKWVVLAGLALASLFPIQTPQSAGRPEVQESLVNEASAKVNAVWGDAAASEQNTSRGCNAVWGDSAFWGNNAVWRQFKSALTALRSLI